MDYENIFQVKIEVVVGGDGGGHNKTARRNFRASHFIVFLIFVSVVLQAVVLGSWCGKKTRRHARFH
jgi:hypothetical protein